MRKLREILRLRPYTGLSIRQIRDSFVSASVLSKKVAAIAEQQSITWPLICRLDDTELAQRFYPHADPQPSSRLKLPDWCAVHKVLRKSDVNEHLLWEEYRQLYPNRCYSYAQYCHLYQQWLKKQRRLMR